MRMWLSRPFNPGHIYPMTKAPPSPCTNICKIEGGICLGCGRTLGEIAAWAKANTSLKTSILNASKARLPRLQAG